jgi:hypothetical protein
MKRYYKHKQSWLLLLLIALFLGVSAQDDVSYKVTVDRTVIPFFAVDSKGNPVYDLQKDELEFHVNGKAVEFGFFPVPVENGGGVPGHVKKPVIFILVDTMFNSPVGMARTKGIIKDLILDRFPGNRFVILENVLGKGISPVIGPETDEKKLLSAVAELRLLPEKNRDFLFLNEDDLSHAPLMKRDIRIDEWNGSDRAFKSLEKTKKDFERRKYRHNIKAFVKALSRLKTMVRSVPGPRMVFLISEGISEGAFHESYSSGNRGGNRYTQNSVMIKPFFLKLLNGVVEAVNLGGCVLFTVNPRKQDMVSMEDTFNTGEAGLKYLARQSGGAYFVGQDIRSMTAAIRRTVSAYYKLAFSAADVKRKKQEIEILCKRKGVHILNPKLSEKVRQTNQRI